jgi:ADP-dependent NAD(P)H-hydrate dehydratase / NAD(P)H-hydrate epimerase
MKFLSAQQMQAWDAFTIENEPIGSIHLMERAAMRCIDWLVNNNFSNNTFQIFCGKGNNGGDGLAIARLLMEKDIAVTVYILEFGAKGTEDFQKNLQRLHQITSNIHFIQSEEHFPLIEKNNIVIDALFGSGLNRPLKDLSESLVNHINRSNTNIISIDVPSGMSVDVSSKENIVIHAKHTLTFQSLKLCFMMAENANCFGDVHVLNIGLLKEFLNNIETNIGLIEKEKIQSFIKTRNAFSHKGNFGHSLLIAGNKGKMGAALLAAKACLRTGAGLLTVSTHQENQSTINSFLPEAMTMDRDDKIIFDNYSTIGMGCGLGTHEDAKKIVEDVLLQNKKPMVIDADALNIISANQNLLQQIPADSIITPHPKEFDRLFGTCNNDFERMHKALHYSKELNIVIVLKNHHTLIAYKGNGYFNNTGNDGLAKGGSGDVLTGMMTSLLGQGYSSLQSAMLGVYLHGLAADISLENQSQESLLATDVIENIGKAFHFIRE